MRSDRKTLIIIIIIIIIIIRNSRKQPYWALHTYFGGKYLCKSTNRFNPGTNDISTMNSNNRIAATLYSLGT